MGNAVAVSAADFDREVLQSPVPVLVDFWAVTCPPCRIMLPHVEALATEFVGKAKVYKVDTDTEWEIASRYGVMAVPSLLFFKDGHVADQIVGAVPKSVIAERLVAGA